MRFSARSPGIGVQSNPWTPQILKRACKLLTIPYCPLQGLFSCAKADEICSMAESTTDGTCGTYVGFVPSYAIFSRNSSWHFPCLEMLVYVQSTP